MRKTISILAVVTFLMTSVCFAAKVDPTKIDIPRDSGRVVETYVSPKADAPVIVYLQDIHVNYEAQKAMAGVLESLIRDHGFDLVLLESKPVGLVKDFKYLRKDAPLEARITAAESLLKEGTITCEDYLDLTTDYNFIADGIEDMELYKKETADLAAIYGVKDEMVKLVSVLQNIASNLKLHIYTKEMRDLDDKIAAYEKDEIGLVEYVKFAETQAAANNIDVKAFPNLALFIESANMENQINFTAVEKERTTAVDAVEKTLKAKAKDDFLAKGLQFRTGDISQGEYYAYLSDTARASKVDISANKNLIAYTTYITTFEKIDTTALFKELDNLVDKIKTAMIKTPEQKTLSQVDKGLSIIAGMTNTKLVPDEYDFYMKNKADFNLDSWLAFLRNNSVKFGLTSPVPDDVAVLKTNMPVLEKFYAVSFERDNAFIANIKTALSKHNKDKAVFIAGGFHTPNMKRLLKENGFSYMVVAPRVEVINDYSEIYKVKMKEDVDYLQKALPATTSVIPAKNVAPLRAAAKENTAAGIEARVREAMAGIKARPAGTEPGQQSNIIAIVQGVLGGHAIEGLGIDENGLEGRLRVATQAQRDAIAAAIEQSMGPAACIKDGRLYGLRINTSHQFLGWNANGERVYADSKINIEEDPVKLARAFPDIAKALAEQMKIAEKDIESAAKTNAEFQSRLKEFVETHERLHIWIDRGMPSLRARITEQEEEDIVHALTMAINGIPLAAAHEQNIEKLLDVAQKIKGVSDLPMHQKFIADAQKMRTGALGLADLKASQPDIEAKYMDLYNIRLADELAKRLVEGETYGLNISDNFTTAQTTATDLAEAVDAHNLNAVKDVLKAKQANLANLNLTDFVTFINVLDQSQRRVLLNMIKDDPALRRFSEMLEGEIATVDAKVKEAQEAAFSEAERAEMGKPEVVKRMQEDVIRQRLVANSGIVKSKDENKVTGFVAFVDSDLYDEAGKDYLENLAKGAFGNYGLDVKIMRLRRPSDYKGLRDDHATKGYTSVLLTKDMSKFSTQDIGQSQAFQTQTLKPQANVDVAEVLFRAAIGIEGLQGLTKDQQRAGSARIAAALAPLTLNTGESLKITAAVIMDLIPGVKSDQDRFNAIAIIRLLPRVSARQAQEFMQQLIFASFA